jgi:hypothetical protein
MAKDRWKVKFLLVARVMLMYKILVMSAMVLSFEQQVLHNKKPPNKACTRLGVGSAFWAVPNESILFVS